MSAKGVLRIKILGDAKGVDSAVGVAVDKVKAGALAMGAAFIAGVGKAMDIEAATDKMSASLGLTAKESERLGGVAGRLYANAYGESMSDVTGAVEAVVSSIGGMRNASAAAVEATTAKVLDLAAAFEMEAGRAAQVAGQMISSGFAKDATHALDLLTVGLQKVPKAVREDLVDAIDEYGPFMKTVGLTGERAMAMLVAAAEKGMYGIDKTGDAIKEFTIRATDMSTASKAGFDILGMSQEKMTAQILAGGDTAAIAFDKIVKGLLGIKDPVKQSQAALALFGTPLEDLSTSEIPKFLQSLLSVEPALGKVDGAAERMGQSLNDNAKTNLTAFWRGLEMAFVNVVGGKVIPAISSMVSWLTTMLGPAFNLIAGIIQTVVITPLTALFGWFNRNRTALSLFGSIVLGMVAPFLAYKGVVMVITGAMRIWRAVVLATKTAFFLLNLVMRANPIGIVITLIGGLVGAIVWLWNKSAGFRNFFIGVWNAIKSAVSAVGDAIQWVIDAVKTAVQWVIDLAKKLASIAVPDLTGMVPGFAGGGTVDAHQLITVGERGRELFIPNAAGRIVPHAETESLIRQAEQDARTQLTTMSAGAATAPAGGGTTVVQTFNFPNYLGTKQDLVRELRQGVRTAGRGSADRYFRPAGV